MVGRREVTGHLLHARAGEEAAPAAAAAAEEEEAAEPAVIEWPHSALDTVDAGTFYLDVSRAGIQYGPHFRMVEKRHINGGAVVLRCGLRP